MLKEEIPQNFAISQAQNMLVQDAYSSRDGFVDWLVNVVGNLHDWEIGELESLLQLLPSRKGLSGEDQVQWKLENNGNFSVKSYCKHLLRSDNMSRPKFPSGQIWKSKVPPRIASFGSEACKESILTIDKLKSRGMVIPNRCYLCMQAEESCNHILLW